MRRRVPVVFMFRIGLTILCLLVGGRFCAATEADLLHVLLAIDTDSAVKRGAGDIRASMEGNLKQLKKLIDEAHAAQGDQWKGRFIVRVLQGKDLTPAKIREVYGKNSPATSASSLFFYYCGHGAFDKKKGHYFYTSGGNISREEIRNLLNNTGARSIILVTDCCANYHAWDQSTLRTNDDLTARLSSATASKSGAHRVNYFRELFLENTGFVDITSSSEGEYSWSSPAGGIFTNHLCMLAAESGSEDGIDAKQEHGWKRVFDRVKQKTLTTFQEARSAAAKGDVKNPLNIKNSQGQTPYAWYLSEYREQNTRRLKIRNDSRQPLRANLRFLDRDYETGQWDWYGKEAPIELVIGPGKAEEPIFNEYPIEAKAIEIWAESTTEPKRHFGQKGDIVHLVNQVYRGPLETYTHVLRGPRGALLGEDLEDPFWRFQRDLDRLGRRK